MNFAKLKVSGVGKFELKSIDELENVVKELRFKYKGRK